jgi:hypothetical protein
MLLAESGTGRLLQEFDGKTILTWINTKYAPGSWSPARSLRHRLIGFMAVARRIVPTRLVIPRDSSSFWHEFEAGGHDILIAMIQ